MIASSEGGMDIEEVAHSTPEKITTEFIDAAAVQAKSLGIDPAYVFIPHPVQDRTDDELRALADTHFDSIIALLLKGNQ